jgi:lipopolysaccharide/colanic/teichoic acid biosynthesis glycosyltransferase
MANQAAQPDAFYDLLKRALDIAGACVGLIAFAPLLLGCGAWIKLRDGGPIFYRQWRVGHNGWIFCIYKLRTMAMDAEQPGNAKFASANDGRIIPGCQWMRRSHIDELPQLWNILTGEMSLVGPRPERSEMFQDIESAMPRFKQRLAGKPGLTGLAQVRNGYTNDTAGARKKLAYDLCYLQNRSIRNELQLILATIPRIWDDAPL